MRIAHVIARLNDGGPARVLLALATQFMARGHQVLVIAGRCGADEPDLTPLLRQAGVAVHTIDDLGRGLNPFADCRSIQLVQRCLRAWYPDVVHTHTAKAGLVGRLAARYLGIPRIHTWHGHVLTGYWSPLVSRAIHLVERVFARLGHCHSLTPRLVVELRDRFHLGFPGTWHCLPIPVVAVRPRSAPWHAQLTPNCPVIGFLGRLVPVKDPRLFLEVVERVAQERPVQALICGDGPLRSAIERHSALMSCPVLCVGFVEAAEALGAMSVLLMTSRNEGLPLVAVEAASAGVPVVAPAVGGLPDLAGPSVAVVERDISVLASAVIAALDINPDEVAVAGQSFAQSLSAANLAPAYERCYRRVLSSWRRLPQGRNS